jgi:hypothetical protein
MSWSDEFNPGCDLHQVLYRDDVLGCVLRGSSIRAETRA